MQKHLGTLKQDNDVEVFNQKSGQEQPSWNGKNIKEIHAISSLKTFFMSQTFILLLDILIFFIFQATKKDGLF